MGQDFERVVSYLVRPKQGHEAIFRTLPFMFAFHWTVRALLRSTGLELVTWATAMVDSAAILLYALGQRRLTVPGKVDFYSMNLIMWPRTQNACF